MSFKFELDKAEMEKAYQALAEAGKVVRKKDILTRAMKQALAPMLRQAREDAPEGPTGNLAAGITVRNAAIRNRKTTGAAIQFGVYVPHAYIVQDGTGPRYRKKDGRYVGIMPPNLFFKIAYEQHKEAFVKNVSKEIIKEIEKSVGRKIKNLDKRR